MTTCRQLGRQGPRSGRPRRSHRARHQRGQHHPRGATAAAGGVGRGPQAVGAPLSSQRHPQRGGRCRRSQRLGLSRNPVIQQIHKHMPPEQALISEHGSVFAHLYDCTSGHCCFYETSAPMCRYVCRTEAGGATAAGAGARAGEAGGSVAAAVQRSGVCRVQPREHQYCQGQLPSHRQH